MRARAFSLGLLAGTIAVSALVLLLKPAAFGAIAAVAYVITALTSALALGLVSGAMMFGHWYLIDLGMDVEYLRSFVRMIAVALIADIVAMGLALVVLALFGGTARPRDRGPVRDHLTLFLMRMVFGPVASTHSDLDVLADAENPADHGGDRFALHRADVGGRRRNARPLHPVSDRASALIEKRSIKCERRIR